MVQKAREQAMGLSDWSGLFENVTFSVQLLQFLPAGDLYRFAGSSKACRSSATASYKTRLNSSLNVSSPQQVLMMQDEDLSFSYEQPVWMETHFSFVRTNDGTWNLREPDPPMPFMPYRHDEIEEANDLPITGRVLVTNMSLPEHLSSEGVDILHCSLSNKLLLVVLTKTFRIGSEEINVTEDEYDSADETIRKELWGVVFHQKDLDNSGRPTIVQKLSKPMGRKSFHDAYDHISYGHTERTTNGRAFAVMTHIPSWEYVEWEFDDPNDLHQAEISFFDIVSSTPDGDDALVVKRNSIMVPFYRDVDESIIEISLSVGGEMVFIEWRDLDHSQWVLIYDVRDNPELLLNMDVFGLVSFGFFTLDNEFVLHLRKTHAEVKEFVDETRFPAFARRLICVSNASLEF